MKIKVLYVEDEPFLGRIVKESLESRDFEVRMVSDGQRALPAFEQFRPDICVLDVMLPHKDGYAIATDIRQLNPGLPIIFLTAKTQTEDVLRGFQSGGNDYVRKPFSMEELIARMHNLLQIASNGTPASAPVDKEPIHIGRYVFVPLRYELQLDGHVRKLSHREAELLRILSENRTAVVQRRAILNQIWGDDSFFNSRNLDVYITRLRDYLRDDPAVEILTIKGVGYRFVAE
ncbi:MAG TPA: response regulator transcription factor [Saprospiraceae bacterium]|nr:response regulator transcription factor [Saprospiraceae bacterium]HMP24922.1 response regulator transcription factor [Saprospiraceae bacterium]